MHQSSSRIGRGQKHYILIILIIHIIVYCDQNISLIFYMKKMDRMSGFDIRLVFTVPPRDSTMQYKRFWHLWNNFPCINTLIYRFLSNCKRNLKWPRTLYAMMAIPYSQPKAFFDQVCIIISFFCFSKLFIMIYCFSVKVTYAHGSCQARFVALNVLGWLYTG